MPKPRLPAAAFWLGFALGGFFDGVLLHQILQWHHLLSALGGDLAAQVLADGVFHAAMYVIAIMALWLLWRARTELTEPRAGARVLAFALIGFAAWHAADAVLSHWLLGIHRIRMDATRPLLWDVGWLLIFGGGPLALGLWLLRRAPRVRAGAASAALAALVAIGAVWAAQPPYPAETALVVFPPSVPRTQALRAALTLGDGLIDMDAAAGFYLVRTNGADLKRFAEAGALLVVPSRAVGFACASWSARS